MFMFPYVTISLETALERLTQNDPVALLFQIDGHNLEVQFTPAPRSEVVALLGRYSRHIYESGIVGQTRDLGIHLNLTHPKYGYGQLFIETRPECRLNEKQLAESLGRFRKSFSGS